MEQYIYIYDHNQKIFTTQILLEINNWTWHVFKRYSVYPCNSSNLFVLADNKGSIAEIYSVDTCENPYSDALFSASFKFKCLQTIIIVGRRKYSVDVFPSSNNVVNINYFELTIII